MNVFKHDDKIFKIKIWKMKINKTMSAIVKIFFSYKEYLYVIFIKDQ